MNDIDGVIPFNVGYKFSKHEEAGLQSLRAIHRYPGRIKNKLNGFSPSHRLSMELPKASRCIYIYIYRSCRRKLSLFIKIFFLQSRLFSVEINTLTQFYITFLYTQIFHKITNFIRSEILYCVYKFVNHIMF